MQSQFPGAFKLCGATRQHCTGQRAEVPEDVSTRSCRFPRVYSELIESFIERYRGQLCWAGVMEGFRWVSEGLYVIEEETEAQRVLSRGSK